MFFVSTAVQPFNNSMTVVRKLCTYLVQYEHQQFGNNGTKLKLNVIVYFSFKSLSVKYRQEMEFEFVSIPTSLW